MQIFTLFYQIKKIVDGVKIKKTDVMLKGLSEKYEPSDQSIKNIMAFSKSYNYDKSDAVGDVEYFSN